MSEGLQSPGLVGAHTLFALAAVRRRPGQRLSLQRHRQMSFFTSMSFSLAMLAGLMMVQPATPLSARAIAAENEHQEVLNTIRDVKKYDPAIQRFFDNSVGYAVLPSVGKGGAGIGAAYGNGELLMGGKAKGKISMTQVTIGLQLGGQSYSEIIFFETQAALDGFRHGDFAFAAQTSAVALKSGSSENADYRDGVVVFTVAKGGLMAEASVGGQKFSYKAY